MYLFRSTSTQPQHAMCLFLSVCDAIEKWTNLYERSRKRKFCKYRVYILTYHFYNTNLLSRGGSRGRVQGVRTPPPSPEMTCGFLIQLVFCKNKLCGLLVLKLSKRRVHPLLKKILDPPLLSYITIPQNKGK